VSSPLYLTHTFSKFESCDLKLNTLLTQKMVCSWITPLVILSTVYTGYVCLLE